MERLTLEDLQTVEKEILYKFSEFCETNNLCFSLCGGTLIGAIRHGGFIPWDDDIDLMMPRPDYERFIELVKENGGNLDVYRSVDCVQLDEQCPSDCIRVYDNRTEVTFENFRVPYKIGCWIDIFPIDGMEMDEKIRIRHSKKMRHLLDIYYICLTKFGGKRRSKLITIFQFLLLPIVPFVRILGYKYYLRKIIKLQKKVSYDESEYVAVVGGRAVEKEIMKKENMYPIKYVMFEGKSMPIIANYDEYLTNLYGDYMKLPPENERVSRHIINTFWK